MPLEPVYPHLFLAQVDVSLHLRGIGGVPLEDLGQP